MPPVVCRSARSFVMVGTPFPWKGDCPAPRNGRRVSSYTAVSAQVESSENNPRLFTRTFRELPAKPLRGLLYSAGDPTWGLHEHHCEPGNNGAVGVRAPRSGGDHAGGGNSGRSRSPARRGSTPWLPAAAPSGPGRRCSLTPLRRKNYLSSSGPPGGGPHSGGHDVRDRNPGNRAGAFARIGADMASCPAGSTRK